MESSAAAEHRAGSAAVKPVGSRGGPRGDSYDAITDLFLGEVGTPSVTVELPKRAAATAAGRAATGGATNIEAADDVPAMPSAAAMRQMESALMLAANVPGLRPIAARCPYAEEVGLALDRRGVMHLLIRVRDADAEFMPELARTRDWVRDHAGLIRLTLPVGTAYDGLAEPGWHVFVPSGRGVSRLLRTGVRIHVAVPGVEEEDLGAVRYVEIS